MNSRSVAGSFPHQGDPERLAYTVSLDSLAGLDVTSVLVTCSSAWGTAAWAEMRPLLEHGYGNRGTLRLVFAPTPAPHGMPGRGFSA